MISFPELVDCRIPAVYTLTPGHRGLQAGRIRLSLLLALACGVAIAARTGVAVLTLMAPVEPVADPGGTETAPAGEVSVDLAALKALDLFSGSSPGGQITARQLPVASSLNLLLQGVMLGGNPQTSVAVIVGNARQDSYRPGDTLPGAGRIMLETIAADHVIIDNNGRKETVWLYTEAVNGVAAGNSVGLPPVPSGAIPLEVTGALSGKTQQGLPVVAATLSEIIRVQPAQENGQLIGYRLSPGEQLKGFVQLGLQTNDVVTQVNGLALNDIANMPRLYALMNEATEVSFLLLREGRPMTLQFALTDTR